MEEDLLGELCELNDVAMQEEKKGVDEAELPVNGCDEVLRDRAIQRASGPSHLSMCPDVMNPASARSALSYLLQHDLFDQDRFTQILNYVPFISDLGDIDLLQKQ